MKKFVFILIAFSTFSLGVLFFYLHPFVEPVSLCEISQYKELYLSKQIRIEGDLYIAQSTEDVSDFENDCYATASLDISEKLKQSMENSKEFENFRELEQNNNELLEEDKRRGIYVARVEIVGEIREREEHNLIPLVPLPPLVIKVNRIKQISPIRFLNYEEISKFNK